MGIHQLWDVRSHGISTAPIPDAAVDEHWGYGNSTPLLAQSRKKHAFLLDFPLTGITMGIPGVRKFRAADRRQGHGRYGAMEFPELVAEESARFHCATEFPRLPGLRSRLCKGGLEFPCRGVQVVYLGQVTLGLSIAVRPTNAMRHWSRPGISTVRWKGNEPTNERPPEIPQGNVQISKVFHLRWFFISNSL